MSDKENNQKPFNIELSVLEEANRMKENGANQTQIRAFLEEHGWSNIKFDLNDVGQNPGVEPKSTNDIPRDENGKIDIAKLPEEIRDTMELIASIVGESNAESEEILEQMIKVCRENSGTFPEFPFDLPVIRQRDMQLLGPDRNKAEMFDFTRPLRHQAIIQGLQTSGQHYGVLSSGNQPQQGYKNMPNKSVGESEYIRPEDRGALLSGYSPEEQMGLKLPDDLAARLTERRTLLTNMLESSGDKYGPRGKFSPEDTHIFKQPIQRGYADGMKSLVERSREAALEMVRTPQLLSEAKLPTKMSQAERSKLIRTFGEVEALEDPRFKHRNQAVPPGMPFFDATLARRRLYKDLIVRLNKEIEEGPLAGLIFVTGVTRGQPTNRAESAVFKDDILFKIEVKMTTNRFGYPALSFRAGNRTRAYQSYYGNLFEKYRQEIRDAETKVMERE